jgi:alanine transaminase
MHNVPDQMKDAIFKLKSLEICPNIVGQIAMDLLINPPNKDTCSDATLRKYNEEVARNFNTLKEKALLIYNKLNHSKYFKCNEIEGAMYAFPSILFPQKFIDEAKANNMQPDYYYCMKLLENTGLITVAGSGFGQKEGTYHFRITNLISPNEKLVDTLNKIEDFNNKLFD